MADYRVLLVTESSASGGAGRHVRELAQWLVERGHSVTVLANRPANLPGHRAVLRSTGERLLYGLEVLPEWSDWRHFGSQCAFAAIPQDAFDVIHLHQVSGGWLSLRALRQLTDRFPTVWTHHDEWAVTECLPYDLTGIVTRKDVLRHASFPRRAIGLSPYHPSFKSRSLSRLLDFCAPRVDLHVTPSAYLAEHVRSHRRYQSARVQTIANATSLLAEPSSQLPRSEARRRIGIADDEAEVVLVVAVNLADAYKGLGHGIPALQALSRTRPKLHVRLLGNVTAAVRQACRGLPFSTSEAHSDEELALHYRSADVTLIPSLADNFPYVALETLACETPYVAFAQGGLREIADEEHNALLASCFNATALTAQMERLLSDREHRSRLGAAGLSWVRQHCSPESFLKSLLIGYSEAIASFTSRIHRAV